MDEFLLILGSVFGGAFFGSFLGPLLLEEWRAAKRRRNWAAPRKRLLLQLLREDGESSWRPIEMLAASIGASPEECRDLLIAIGARGGLGQARPDGTRRELWAIGADYRPDDFDPDSRTMIRPPDPKRKAV